MRNSKSGGRTKREINFQFGFGVKWFSLSLPLQNLAFGSSSAKFGGPHLDAEGLQRANALICT